MKPLLESQTSQSSIARLIRPSAGPIACTNWEAGHIERNRRIYDYELVFFNQGKGHVITENQVFICSPGSVIVIPPDIVHCTVADTKMERWCIHFDWYGDCRAHITEEPIWVYTDHHDSWNPALIAQPPPESIQLEFPYKRDLDDETAQTVMDFIRQYLLLESRHFSRELLRHGLLWQLLGMIFSPPSQFQKDWLFPVNNSFSHVPSPS